VVGSLRKALKDADELYATDQDAGRSVVASPRVLSEAGFPVKRMVFRITGEAIQEAIASPRAGQEARRGAGRSATSIVVGYEWPVLWRRVAALGGRMRASPLGSWSARKRTDGVPRPYWDLDGRFAAAAPPARGLVSSTASDSPP
jgi:DNA topoisomerase IA